MGGPRRLMRGKAGHASVENRFRRNPFKTPFSGRLLASGLALLGVLSLPGLAHSRDAKSPAPAASQPAAKQTNNQASLAEIQRLDRQTEPYRLIYMPSVRKKVRVEAKSKSGDKFVTNLKMGLPGERVLAVTAGWEPKEGSVLVLKTSDGIRKVVDLDPFVAAYEREHGKKPGAFKLVVDKGTDKEGFWITILVVTVDKPNGEIKEGAMMHGTTLVGTKVYGSETPYVLASAQ